MNVFTAELKKLWRLFRSDLKALGAGIIPPTVILIAFALTVGNFSSISVAYVNKDAGAYGAVLETSIFSQLSPLGQKPYFTETAAASEEEALALYQHGEVSAVIIVPENFSAQFADGETPAIAFHFNNYNTDIAKNMRLYLNEGILSFYQETDANLQISITEKDNVDLQLPWFYIVASGVFLLAFLLGAVVNVLYLLSKERENGTQQFYRLAPNHIMPSLAARVLMALLESGITASVSALVIDLLTGIHLAAYALPMLPPLLMVGLIFIFLAVIVGLFVESFSGSIIFSLIMTCVFWFLSGATFSVKNNTGILHTVSSLLPSTYALSDIRGIIFQMDASIGGVSYAQGWLIMTGYLLASMFFASYLYHKKLIRYTA